MVSKVAQWGAGTPRVQGGARDVATRGVGEGESGPGGAAEVGSRASARGLGPVHGGGRMLAGGTLEFGFRPDF